MVRKIKNAMKVYLGKSYQSNPDTVVAINSYLKKNKVEIAKYEGGAYDPDLIIKHDPDFVVIIPPYFSQKELEQVEDLEENSFYMGKGNDSEGRKLPERTYFVVPDPKFEIGDTINLCKADECEIEIKEHEPRRTWSKIRYDDTKLIKLSDLISPKTEEENTKKDPGNIDDLDFL